MEIKRKVDLMDAMLKVAQSEGKDLVTLQLTEDEEERFRLDYQGDLIATIARQIALNNDIAKDFDDDDWDDFYDEVYNNIVLGKEIEFTGYVSGDTFWRLLTAKVENILEKMQAKMYEVTVEITTRVTVPVLARSEQDAEDWVENMSSYDLTDYIDNDGDVVDTSVYRVEQTNEKATDYGNYEDAT